VIQAQSLVECLLGSGLVLLELPVSEGLLIDYISHVHRNCTIRAVAKGSLWKGLQHTAYRKLF
jgi:hypothetical protein